MAASGTTPVWPLFALAVETSRLRLEYATDEHLQSLARFRADAVIRPGEIPFEDHSSFYMPTPEAEWKAVAGEWGARARTSPEWWHLSFAAVIDDVVVGQQNITAADFRRVRTVNSFSFLARRHQGKGVGKEMRSAVLHLAFAGLGARRAESDAFEDNHASLGVSRSLGYEPNGTMLASRPGGSVPMLRFVLTEEKWQAQRRDDVEIHDLEPCLPLLGLDAVA